MHVAPRAGTTLIELIVALLLLAVGAFAAARTSVAIVRLASRATARSSVATIAQSRAEWMLAVPCATLADSSTTTRGITEAWTLAPSSTTYARTTLIVTSPKLPHAEPFSVAVPC